MEDYKSQRSVAWHEFRKNKIGGSDAAAVMGLSPWKTSKQLWEERKGLRVPFSGSKASERGIELEPHALKFAERETGLSFSADVLQHPVHDRIIASLDGIDRDKKVICECKASQRFYDMAETGEVFPDVMCQIQHQLFVSRFEKAILCCYDGFRGKIIDIERNDDFISCLLEKELEFLEILDGDTPPDDKDKLEQIQLEEEENKLVLQWIDSSRQLKSLEEKEKALKQKIISLGQGKDAYLLYKNETVVKMNKIQRKGTVDWDGVCKKFSINKKEIETFRKEQIEYYKLVSM